MLRGLKIAFNYINRENKSLVFDIIKIKYIFIKCYCFVCVWIYIKYQISFMYVFLIRAHKKFNFLYIVFNFLQSLNAFHCLNL